MTLSQQPGGNVARCDKSCNPLYQFVLGQQRRVTLIRHHDDLELVGGFPATKVTKVKKMIDPTTAAA
jgi:hypothetical protein